MLKIKEWPLVLFTFLVQSSVGVFILAFGPVLLQRSWENRWLFRAADRWGLALLGLVGLSVLVSLFHRGQSLSVYLPVRETQPGWLNREIASLGIFFLLLVALEFLLIIRASGPGMALLVVLTGLSGLTVIYVMSRLHCLAGVRLWKSGRTAFFFFMTAFLVGSLALLLFQRIGSPALMLPWLGVLYWRAAVLLTGLAFLGLLLFDQVSGLFPLPDTGAFRSRAWRVVFVLRLVMLLAALAFLLISHSGERIKNPADMAFPALGLLLVIIEELLGRVAFYNLVEPAGPGN